MELAALGRLIGVGWVLARSDALLPRELRDIYPAPVALASRLLGLVHGAEARRGRPGERLARSLERLGPVAIKLGQLLSTRADIFGMAFADDLSRLKDKLAPFPTARARREIELALGQPVDAVFARFGEPVAAASLAQAHDAELKDGRRVAVKVLRPGIEQQVERDAAVMTLAGAWVEAWSVTARRLEPVALAQTVVAATRLELDLRLEAAGAEELAGVMARDGYMSAPRIVWEGVGKRVLTQEWAGGTALTDAAALDLQGLDRQALADNLLRAFLAQALDHGVFHADLHEGNLFVAAPASLVAVDFGIVGRLDASARRYLAEILWGFLNRDYERVARVHFEAGYVPARHSVAAFAQALRAVGEQVFGRPASEISMSRVLIQLFEITALFEMKLRPELVLLQKTMMTVEGVARRIQPDHDIWAAADPVVRRFMLRELSPPAQVRRFADEALSALRSLVRLIEAGPAQTPAAPAPPQSQLAGFAMGAVVAAAAFLLARYLV